MAARILSRLPVKRNDKHLSWLQMGRYRPQGSLACMNKSLAYISDWSVPLYLPVQGKEQLVNLMQLLLVKVSLAGPSRTGNALTVEDEREIMLEIWKQPRHSILPNSLRRPGCRLRLFQRLPTRILIHRLHNIIVYAELFWPALLPSRAVFSSSHASRSSYESRPRNAARSKPPFQPDPSRDFPVFLREHTRAVRP